MKRITLREEYIFVVFVLIFLTLSIISNFVFLDYPFSADEHHYYMQAYHLIRGKLFYDLHAPWEWLPAHTVIIGDRLTSPYQPGFGLILGFAMLFHLEGVVNPLISTISLYILYLFSRTFFSFRFSMISVILVFLNPYFFGYACSYFTQSLSGLLIITTFLMLRKYSLRNEIKFMWIAGASAGYLFLTRQLDGACLGLFLVGNSLIQQKYKLRDWIWVPGFLLGIISLLSYNWFGFGKFGVSLVNFNLLFPIDYAYANFPQNIFTYLSWYADNIATTFVPIYWDLTVKLSGYLLYMLATVSLFYSELDRKWKFRIVALLALFFFAYAAAPFSGWPVYGARYTYYQILFVGFLATAALQTMKRNLSNYIVVFIILSQLVLTGFKLQEYSRRFSLASLIWKDISRVCPDKSAVIVKPEEIATKHFFSVSEFSKSALDSGEIPYNSFIGHSRYLLTVGPSNQGSPFKDFQKCVYDGSYQDFVARTVKKSEGNYFFIPRFESSGYPEKFKEKYQR